MTYQINRDQKQVARIHTTDSIVTACPPELRWTMGLPIKKVLDWCMSKGLSWTVIA